MTIRATQLIPVRDELKNEPRLDGVAALDRLCQVADSR